MKSNMNFPILANDNQTLIITLIAVGATVAVVLVVFLILFLLRKKGQPKAKKVSDVEWFLALGGQKNIKSVTAVGSRLSLILINKDNIDRERLKQLGVSSVLVMSNKVTLVIEGQAERIAEVINNSL